MALREEIKIEDAQIICELENGKREKYNIKIQKVFLNNNKDNKSMLIKITDEKLLEKTTFKSNKIGLKDDNVA